MTSTVASAEAPAASTLGDTPYKGLRPYAEEDAPFFFGRESWRGIIIDNLKAHRLTLLYGESGVGKSSVLRAGVAHQLREQARLGFEENGRPDHVVVVFSAWRDDPLAALSRAIEESVAGALGEQPSEPATPKDLMATLEAATQRAQCRLFLILDQFEEYFLYHSAEDDLDTFAAALPGAVARRDLRVSFLISIREDALAKLDRFKGRIPNLFDNYLRIEHLDRDSAREAVERPRQRFNELRPDAVPVEIEPQLVEAILDEVEAGRLQPGQHETAAAVSPAAGEHTRIEAPYLQLVLTRLWDEELSTGSHVLRLETLTRLGGAEGIVETHLDSAMSSLPPRQRDIAAQLFRYLVTRSRTKIAHRASDLADWIELPEAEVTPVLEALSASKTRILRPVGQSSYEIYHDVLAEAILAWRTTHEAEQRIERERHEADVRNRRRLIRIGVGVGLVGLVAALALSAFAIKQWKDANGLEKISRSRVVAAGAISQLPVDPDLSLDLAVAAVNLRRTVPEAQDALRRALLAQRTRLVLGGHEKHRHRMFSAVFSHDGSLVLTTASGRATVWDAATGRSNARLGGHGAFVRSAAFDQSGTHVVTADADGTARIWNANSGKALVVLHPNERFNHPSTSFVPHVAASLSPDGKLVLMAGPDGAARLWDVGSGRERAVMRGQRGKLVNSAAFSPDGTQIVTASDDRTARIWDLNGRSLGILKGHRDEVNEASFSPDGRFVLTASKDGTARVWSVATGSPIQILRPSVGQLRSALFSPLGNLVVTVGAGGQARLWQLPKRGRQPARQIAALGSHVGSPFAFWAQSVSFSPDARFIVAARSDGTAGVWRVDGESVVVLRGHKGPLSTAAFSPGGKLIVSASRDGTARIWRGATRLPSPIRRVHLGETGVHRPFVSFSEASFSPDGRFLATAKEDGTASIWNVATGQTAVVKAGGLDERIGNAAFSPDGKLLVTAGLDGAARLWRTASGEPGPVLRATRHGSVRTADFTADGKFVVTSSGDGTTGIWRTGGGTLVRALPADRESFLQTLSPDGRFVVTVTGDRRVRLWRVASGKPVADLGLLAVPRGSAVYSPDSRFLIVQQFGGSSVWQIASGNPRLLLRLREQFLAFSPDSRLLVAAGTDGAVRIREVSTGRLLGVLPGYHSSTLRSAVFSPNGRFLATVDEGSTPRLWSMARRTLIAGLKGHRGTVWFARFSPDSRFVVTASLDGSARVWRSETGRPLSVLPGHAGPVWKADFSPDGRLILTVAERDTKARVWQTESGRLIRALGSHKGPVRNAAFSPDARLLVTVEGESGGEARVWELATGKPLKTYGGPNHRLSSVGASLDGKLVGTGSTDGTTRIWALTGPKLAGARPSQILAQDDTVSSVAFSNDGKLIVTGGGDGTARIWGVSGRLVHVLRTREGSVATALFSPDGKLIFTGGDRAALWDTASGKPIANLRGAAQSAAFGPDGKLLVTNDYGTLRVWSVDSRQQVDELRVPEGDAQSVTFSPDGRRLLVVNEQGIIRAYSCDGCGTIDELLSEAKGRGVPELTSTERHQYFLDG